MLESSPIRPRSVNNTVQKKQRRLLSRNLGLSTQNKAPQYNNSSFTKGFKD